MKQVDVCAFGNALMDLTTNTENPLLEEWGFPKGRSIFLDDDQHAALLEEIKNRSIIKTAAGSAANSIILIRQLGGTVALESRLGDDNYGREYLNQFGDLGIVLSNPLVIGGKTGTCITLITPDGERTMPYNLGVLANLSRSDIDPERIAMSKWLFVEGYLLCNSTETIDATFEAIKVAKKGNCKIAFSLSGLGVVKNYRQETLQVLKDADVVFGNLEEARGLTCGLKIDDVLRRLAFETRNFFITNGAKGAYFYYNGELGFVEAFSCKPVSTLGAGDAFAGAVIYGLVNEYSPKQAALGGAYLAMKVVSQLSSRLQAADVEDWEENKQRIINP